MPEDILQHANRAAVGIRPLTNSSRSTHTIKLYAKPAADTLATLARVADKRRGEGAHARGFNMPGGGGFINPLNNRQPIRDQGPFRRPLGGDPGPVSLDGQMTGAILGQFVAENTAGRTAIAKHVVAFVRKVGARHGMDSLLLTAMLHLEHAHDPMFKEALEVWRSTSNSAGSTSKGDSGVVFDPQRQGLASIDESIFSDPFSGGVCAPAAVDKMQSLRGRDVGIGSFAVVIVLGLIGAAKGAIDAVGRDAGAGGVIWGAISGAGNAVIDAVGGMLGALIGFATQDTGKPTSADTNFGFVNVHTNGDGPLIVINPGAGADGGTGKESLGNGSKDIGDVSNPNPGGGASSGNEDYKQLGKDGSGNNDKDQSTSSKDVSNNDKGGGTDGGETDTGTGPEDGQVPPGDTGFPSPDSDDGNPWSLVAAGPMVRMSAARAMIAANKSLAFTVAQFPGLEALQGATEVRSPALTQFGILGARGSLDTRTMGKMTALSRTIATQFGAHAQISSQLGGLMGTKRQS